MAKQVVTELKKLDRREIVIPIRGTSPLIVHKFSAKMRQQMLDKQMKKTVVREAKNPQEQYEGSLYTLPAKNKKGSPRYGFPIDGFKQAMVRAGKSLGIVMTDARGAFFVEGEYSPEDGRDMQEILGTPQMREDMVRLETGVADVRFRAQFTNWTANLRITYNAGIISAEQLVNMLDVAGFSVGVGEWRPERNGTMGRFQVVTSK